MNPSNLPPQHFQNPGHQVQYPTLPPINNQGPQNQNQLAQPLIGQPQYAHFQPSFASNLPAEVQKAHEEIRALDKQLDDKTKGCADLWFFFVFALTGIACIVSVIALPYIVVPATIMILTLNLRNSMRSKSLSQVRSAYHANIAFLVICLVPLVFSAVMILTGQAQDRGGIFLLFLCAVLTPFVMILGVNVCIARGMVKLAEKRMILSQALEYVPNFNNQSAGHVGIAVN